MKSPPKKTKKVVNRPKEKPIPSAAPWLGLQRKLHSIPPHNTTVLTLPRIPSVHIMVLHILAVLPYITDVLLVNSEQLGDLLDNEVLVGEGHCLECLVVWGWDFGTSDSLSRSI